MFPLPYRMPPDAIYSGGQQFGTLPNPPAGIIPPGMTKPNVYRNLPEVLKTRWNPDMEPDHQRLISLGYPVGGGRNLVIDSPEFPRQMEQSLEYQWANADRYGAKAGFSGSWLDRGSNSVNEGRTPIPQNMDLFDELGAGPMIRPLPMSVLTGQGEKPIQPIQLGTDARADVMVPDGQGGWVASAYSPDLKIWKYNPNDPEYMQNLQDEYNHSPGLQRRMSFEQFAQGAQNEVNFGPDVDPAVAMSYRGNGSSPSPLEYARQEEELRRRRTQIMQGLPVSSTPGISPAAEALVRNYRASKQVDEQMARNVARYGAGAPPGYVQYNQPQEPPPEPDPVGFDDAAIRQYMMGRYLNNSTGLDRNMRMRDARVRQADADNGVDRFFSRVVAPMAGGAGGAMGSKGAMEAMQAWQNSLNNNILRNRQFQAAHINDLQANQNVAYNQAMANDPRTLKNQREMMRAYYYGQGVLGRNEHYRNSDSNTTQKIENQRQHWGAQEGHWNQQDANAGRRTEIYQQNADTNQEYKRGMLRVNQQNADTRKNLSEEQIRHLQRVDEIAQGRLDETLRIDTARINKIYDDMATGAVNRQKGMAQIDQIYNEMDVKQQKIQFDYDKLTADIEGRNLDREQRDRAEVGRNQRAAAGLSYDKDGKAQYKTDESFRTQVNQPSPSAPSARVRPPVSRNSVVVPRRQGTMNNGLVPPPPAVPIQPQGGDAPMQRRGGGIAAALQHYRDTPASQKAVMRAYFISKYGQDPDAQ